MKLSSGCIQVQFILAPRDQAAHNIFTLLKRRAYQSLIFTFYSAPLPTDLHLASQLSDALRTVLREARESAALSLGEVAARSGLNRQAITFIESGERRPTTETLSTLTI